MTTLVDVIAVIVSVLMILLVLLLVGSGLWVLEPYIRQVIG